MSLIVAPTRRQLCEETVVDQIRLVVQRVIPALTENSPWHLPLTALGMDSIMAMEISAIVADTYRVPLTAIAAFEHPTLGELSRHVLVLVSSSDAPAGVVARRAPAQS